MRKCATISYFRSLLFDRIAKSIAAFEKVQEPCSLFFHRQREKVKANRVTTAQNYPELAVDPD
jgi:hypothetical protein